MLTISDFIKVRVVPLRVRWTDAGAKQEEVVLQRVQEEEVEFCHLSSRTLSPFWYNFVKTFFWYKFLIQGFATKFLSLYIVYRF